MDQSTYTMEFSILVTKAGDKALMADNILCYYHTVILSTTNLPGQSTNMVHTGTRPMCFIPWMIPINLLYNNTWSISV